ncbi:MAG: BatA domain-containing protein [Bacteroidetes bacterium]|nr:BatA domain-containing protein [Bacteroidota bacterium]
MVFAQPLFLIALTALAIPVIIHLFNFRKYKKIYFTNVKFIAEIKQETKKRSQLKHLLILLARLLAVACLVFVFAQPYLPSSIRQKKLKGSQAVSIYIDNSFSMEALASGGRLLDEARSKAIEIADACRPSDLFQLLTADFEGRHQRLVSRDEFRTLVEEVKISPAVRSLSEVMKREEDMFSGVRNMNPVAYIISDFQRTTSGVTNVKPDTAISWFFVPVVAAKQNNLFIDTAWFDNPVLQPLQPAKLRVKIRNSSDERLEKIPLQLAINNTQKSVASFAVDPHSETTVVLPFTNNAAGVQSGTLSVPDYPVTWDDKLYLSYPIASAVPILSINGDKPSRFLDALFASDSSFIFRNSGDKQLDFSSFGRYPLIIMNGVKEISTGLRQEFLRYVMNGGNILIFPPDKADLRAYNELLSGFGAPVITSTDTTRLNVSELNTESMIFRDVFERDASGKIILPENADLPRVLKHYTLNRASKSATEDLMKLQNGQAFLTVTKSGKGQVYLSAVSLDDKASNFPKNSVFVPVLYKIAILSVPAIHLYYSLSADNGIVIENDSLKNKEVYKIRKLDSDFESIPETKSNGSVTLIYPRGQIREAGLYEIMEGSRNVEGVAFNYDRRESDLSCYTGDELNALLKRSEVKYFAVLKGKQASLSKQIRDINQGTPLWKYFVLGALACLLAEIMLIRLWKD